MIAYPLHLCLMIMVERFNANLHKYSRNLTALNMLRAQLSTISPEGLLSYLAKMDSGQKGYFTEEEIATIWMKGICLDQ